MISFVGKVVKAPISIPYIPGKKIKGHVVWKNGVFRIRIDKELYDIEGWDDISECKWIYALPTNTYHTPWYRKPYMPPVDPDRDVLAMTLRYWGKYWHGITLYGKLVNGKFVHHKKKKEYESSISEVITTTV